MEVIMKANVILVLWTGILVDLCSCNPLCPTGWTLNDGGCYIYINSQQEWQPADDSCGQMVSNDECPFVNGHLVSITSAEEDNFVYALRNSFEPTPTESFWIGSTYSETESQFVWSDGSIFGYSNWAPDQPSGTPSSAQCVANWNAFPGQWDNQPCIRTYDYVCEVAAISVCRQLVVMSNQPQMKRNGGLLYVYAIESIAALGPSDEIYFKKTLPSTAVQSGVIEADGLFWGCYLQVSLLRARGAAYGIYNTTSKAGGDESTVSLHTFVKPASNVLNTRGIYTLTVYRNPSNPLEVEYDRYVMVLYSPKCYKIIWKDDKNRIVNVGTRLKIERVEQAGIYTIHRQGRKQRGWIAQVEIIVASCPEEQAYIDGACTPVSLTCKNGGILSDSEARCVCPPYMTGDDCTSRVQGYEDFTIGSASGKRLRCRDLVGGDPKCKGHLICLGDLYGCKCAPGWMGNKCDRPCRKGRWGADCNQNCPSENRDCSRFFGV